MSLHVRLAENDERVRIERMMEPYLCGLGAPPGFVYPNLDAYWKDTSRYPYIIVHGDQFVGFALVRRVTNEPTWAPVTPDHSWERAVRSSGDTMSVLARHAAVARQADLSGKWTQLP